MKSYFSQKIHLIHFQSLNLKEERNSSENGEKRESYQLTIFKLGVSISSSVRFWAKISNRTEPKLFFFKFLNRTEPKTGSNRPCSVRFGPVFFPSKPM
jgi:hypothetical protein